MTKSTKIIDDLITQATDPNATPEQVIKALNHPITNETVLEIAARYHSYNQNEKVLRFIAQDPRSCPNNLALILALNPSKEVIQIIINRNDINGLSLRFALLCADDSKSKIEHYPDGVPKQESIAYKATEEMRVQIANHPKVDEGTLLLLIRRYFSLKVISAILDRDDLSQEIRSECIRKTASTFRNNTNECYDFLFARGLLGSLECNFNFYYNVENKLNTINVARFLIVAGITGDLKLHEAIINRPDFEDIKIEADSIYISLAEAASLT